MKARALTNGQVQEGRERARMGEKISAVARCMGVNYQILYNAIRGYTYRHVCGPEPVEPEQPTGQRPARQTTARLEIAAANGKRPCVHCEILTENKSGVCSDCWERGRQ